MGRGRGPGKFLNFNQVAFERVWLLLKERERLMLKSRGREWVLGLEACLQAVSCGTPRLVESLGWTSRAPLPWQDQAEECRSRRQWACGERAENVCGKGRPPGAKLDNFFLL